MTGEEIPREIIHSLSVQYRMTLNLVVGMMHDRAACNGVALRTLKVAFPTIVDVGCFSHTLDPVGDKFVTPCLLLLSGGWVLFSHSPKDKLGWRERTGQSFQGYSSTHW